jgi:hypothetical protein
MCFIYVCNDEDYSANRWQKLQLKRATDAASHYNLRLCVRFVYLIAEAAEGQYYP